MRLGEQASERVAAWADLIQRSLPPADAPPEEQANALRLQGRAQSRLGQADAAAASFAAALAIDRRLGLPERIALDLVEAADNEQRRAQWAPARDFYERAVAVYRAAGQAQAAEAVQRKLDALPRAAR